MPDAIKAAFTTPAAAAVAEALDLSHPVHGPADPFAEEDTAAACPSDWQATLGCGAIVLFRFPVRLPGDGDMPKTRPCLVLEVLERGGRRFALLAYGTSAATAANHGYEVTVGTAEAVAEAGLDRYTRFVGARPLLVSLDHPDFRPAAPDGSPVIGRLGPVAERRMHAVRAHIHAERDIAANRRESARRERRERRSQTSPRWARPVSVERRRPAPGALLPGSASPVPSPESGPGRRAGTLSLASTPTTSADEAPQ